MLLILMYAKLVHPKGGSYPRSVRAWGYLNSRPRLPLASPMCWLPNIVLYLLSNGLWHMLQIPGSSKNQAPASKASTTMPIPQVGPQPNPRSRHTIGTYREGQWFFKLAKLVLQIQDFFIRNIVCIFRYVNDSIGIDRHRLLWTSLEQRWIHHCKVWIADWFANIRMKTHHDIAGLDAMSRRSRNPQLRAPKTSHKEIERRKIAERTHGREAVCVLYLEKVGKWSSMARDMEVRDFSTLFETKK